MLKKLLIILILILTLFLTGCTEKKEEEYNTVNINANINTAKEISNIIVSNITLDEVLEKLENYEYRFSGDLFKKNFDFTKSEIRYLYGFELDNSRYISKSTQQAIEFGINDAKGEHSVYITQRLDVDYTEEFKNSSMIAVEDNLDYIKVLFIFKFDKDNKIIDYSMDYEFIYKEIKEEGEN